MAAGLRPRRARWVDAIGDILEASACDGRAGRGWRGLQNAKTPDKLGPAVLRSKTPAHHLKAAEGQIL